MRIIKSSVVSEGITYTAGYTNNSVVNIIHVIPASDYNEKGIHYHSKDHEYYYVINGSITVDVENTQIRIDQGSCLEVLPMEKHGVSEVSRGAEYIVVRTNNAPGDKIHVS